jgi:hypothetical protein
MRLFGRRKVAKPYKSSLKPSYTIKHDVALIITYTYDVYDTRTKNEAGRGYYTNIDRRKRYE